jgi:hypothetical protein
MKGLWVFLAILPLMAFTMRPGPATAYEMTPDLANKLTFSALTAKPAPPPRPARRQVSSRHVYSSQTHKVRHDYVRARTTHRPVPVRVSPVRVSKVSARTHRR